MKGHLKQAMFEYKAKIKRYIPFLALFLVILLNIILKWKVVYFPFYEDERGIILRAKYGTFDGPGPWYFPFKYFMPILFFLFKTNPSPYAVLCLITNLFPILSIFFLVRKLTYSNLTAVLASFFYAIYGTGLGYMLYFIHQIFINISYGLLIWSMFFLLKEDEGIKNYFFSACFGLAGIILAPPRAIFFSVAYIVFYAWIWFRKCCRRPFAYIAKNIFACALFLMAGIRTQKTVNSVRDLIYKEEFSLKNIVDGEITNDSNKNYWANLSDLGNCWIEIDLRGKYFIEFIKIYNTNLDRGVVRFKSGISEKGKDYDIIFEGDLPKEEPMKIAVNKKFQFLRIYIDSFYGHSAALNEVEIYAKGDSGLYNVALNKPVKASYNRWNFIFDKAKTFISVALLLNVLEPKWTGLLLMMIIVAAFIISIFSKNGNVFLIFFGGILIVGYFLLSYLSQVGLDYHIRCRHFAPCVLGFSTFWAGIFGCLFKKTGTGCKK